MCPRLVAEVISAWTGVPVSQLAREHSAKVSSFGADLGARIRGQDQAIHALDRSMRATAAGLNKPDAPVGVFLLVGPSASAKPKRPWFWRPAVRRRALYHHHQHVRVQEKHTVSRLIGAPPGTSGYGEGGMLTRPASGN